MGLEIHTTYNNHDQISSHLVARGPEGVDGVVLEAKHLGRHSDLVEQAKASGVAVRVDPCTFELITPAASELPFGPDHAVSDLAVLEPWNEVTALVEAVAQHANGAATVQTPPYLYVTGDAAAIERRLELNGRWVNAARRRSPYLELVPILAIARRDLVKVGLDALDEYIARLAAADVDGLEVRIGPLTNDSSATILASVFDVLDHLRAAGVPGVRLGQNPTVGVSAYAVGLVDGITTGILDKQSVDVSALINRRTKAANYKAAGEKPDGGGGTVYKRVYLPTLGITVAPDVARDLFNDSAIRASLRCRDIDCASAIAAPLTQPRRHDLHSRIAEHAALSIMPATIWRQTAHRRTVTEQLKAAQRAAKAVPSLKISKLLTAVHDTIALDDRDTKTG